MKSTFLVVKGCGSKRISAGCEVEHAARGFNTGRLVKT